MDVKGEKSERYNKELTGELRQEAELRSNIKIRLGVVGAHRGHKKHQIRKRPVEMKT